MFNRELSNVEGNFQTPAEFADADVVHAGESPVKQAVCQFNVIDHLEQAGNADQSVNLAALVDAGNLDFVVVIDFPGGIVQLCPNFVIFAGNRPGALGLLTEPECKYTANFCIYQNILYNFLKIF